MKTALITGVTGQDGSYLSELLLEKGYKVYGLARRTSTSNKSRISHLIGQANFDIVECDITDASGMYNIVRTIQPNEIYHLAAQSHVGTSFTEPMCSLNINAIGTVNLLEAIRNVSPTTKFYNAATSELFGNTSVAPQNESTPFKPDSPYAIAKLASFHFTRLYREAYGLFACNGILFNHESPRRGENFVTRKITKYIGELVNCEDRSKFPKLKLGNLSAKRDWSHAKDMVHGMYLMLQHSKPKDFVLSSGMTRSIREFLDTAFSYMGLRWEDFVVSTEDNMRPSDVNLLWGDSSKARNLLGWNPEISFGRMVRDMIDNDIVECEK